MRWENFPLAYCTHLYWNAHIRDLVLLERIAQFTSSNQDYDSLRHVLSQSLVLRFEGFEWKMPCLSSGSSFCGVLLFWYSVVVLWCSGYSVVFCILCCSVFQCSCFYSMPTIWSDKCRLFLIRELIPMNKKIQYSEL